MESIHFTSGGIELADSVKKLWEKLNSQHAGLSEHFARSIHAVTFEKRKKHLLCKSKDAEFLIELAFINGQSDPVGYSISSVNHAGVAEVESIFILEKYRNQGIGRHFMENAMKWMESKKAAKKMIGVLAGNEKALGFYARFGFHPRTILLEQKS